MRGKKNPQHPPWLILRDEVQRRANAAGLRIRWAEVGPQRVVIVVALPRDVPAVMRLDAEARRYLAKKMGLG